MKFVPKSYITLKQRVKDKHAKILLKLSKEVNFVFNYINHLSFQHILKKQQFLSAFDIAQYTKGCTDKKLGLDRIHLHSQSVQAIAEEYVLQCKQHKKRKLNCRVSNYLNIDEKYTIQDCAYCGAKTGSKGVAGLGKRNWSCAECGTSHNRDINSANNILMCWHAHLAKGIPCL